MTLNQCFFFFHCLLRWNEWKLKSRLKTFQHIKCWSLMKIRSIVCSFYVCSCICMLLKRDAQSVMLNSERCVIKKRYLLNSTVFIQFCFFLPFFSSHTFFASNLKWMLTILKWILSNTQKITRFQNYMKYFYNRMGKKMWRRKKKCDNDNDGFRVLCLFTFFFLLLLNFIKSVRNGKVRRDSIPSCQSNQHIGM